MPLKIPGWVPLSPRHQDAGDSTLMVNLDALVGGQYLSGHNAIGGEDMVRQNDQSSLAATELLNKLADLDVCMSSSEQPSIDLTLLHSMVKTAAEEVKRLQQQGNYGEDGKLLSHVARLENSNGYLQEMRMIATSARQSPAVLSREPVPPEWFTPPDRATPPERSQHAVQLGQLSSRASPEWSSRASPHLEATSLSPPPYQYGVDWKLLDEGDRQVLPDHSLGRSMGGLQDSCAPPPFATVFGGLGVDRTPDPGFFVTSTRLEQAALDRTKEPGFYMQNSISGTAASS